MVDDGPPSSPPAGWYTTSDGRTRWWDGAAWTDHYQPDATPAAASSTSDADHRVAKTSGSESAAPAAASNPAHPIGGSGQTSHNKRNLIALVILLVVGLGAGATAIATAGPSDEERRIAAETRESAAAAEAEQEAEAELAAQKEACESAITDFKAAVEAVDSKLNVGLVQSDLNDALGEARVAYDQMDIDAISSDEYCLSDVAGPLEEAFNIYVKTNTKWNKCIQNYGCEVEGAVLKDMQTKWGKASVKVVLADTALENYGSATSS